MIKKLMLFFSFLTLNVSADSTAATSANRECHIELFSKIYRLESNQTLTARDIIKSSDCDEILNNKLSQIIANSSGSVSSDFLYRELEKEFKDIDFKINPRKISFLDLNSSMRDQLTSGGNLYFLETKSLNGLRSLGLIEGEILRPSCESCLSFGEKNIKIDIVNPLLNSMRTMWFSSRIMAKIRVYKSKRNLSFQQKNLVSDDFYPEDIFSSNPDNVLTTLENIHFYKTNKTIVQGSIISNLDLQPVNLVMYGTPVNIIFKSQNINLQRTALPSRSAHLGEVIELKNPSNNKMIVGKVIDYNKVVIEL